MIQVYFLAKINKPLHSWSHDLSEIRRGSKFVLPINKGVRKELVKGGLFRVGEKDIQTLITFLLEKGEDMSHSLVSLKIKHSTKNKTRLVSLTMYTILITL